MKNDRQVGPFAVDLRPILPIEQVRKVEEITSPTTQRWKDSPPVLQRWKSGPQALPLCYDDDLMTSARKNDAVTPAIKTPQELVHIKHKISLRQYKYWILALRAYHEEHLANNGGAGESDFTRIPVEQIAKYLGYEPVRAELRADLEALRKEAIIYNVLGKDGKPAQRGAGFISEWEVSANWVGFKLPGFLVECIERLDLKNTMFQALNWSVFNSFSGKYEAILYKLCKDYVGVRRTPYMAIDNFREYMGLAEKEYAEFKDLNKFVITGPIKRINDSEVSDILVEAVFAKQSRRVVGVHFTVTLKNQSAFPFEIDPVFAHARVAIPGQQQQKYLAEKSPEEIASSIDRANDYAANLERKGESVNLGAIYHTAITQDWGKEVKARVEVEEKKRERKVATEKAVEENKRQATQAQQELLESQERESGDLLRSLDAMTAAEQDELWNAFFAGTPGAAHVYSRKKSSVVARRALAAWMARRQLG